MDRQTIGILALNLCPYRDAIFISLLRETGKRGAKPCALTLPLFLKGEGLTDWRFLALLLMERSYRSNWHVFG
jgi:hypothetical protein